MVSAPVVARERGVHITETRKDAQGAFGSYMRLIVTTEAKTRSVAGTIYSDGKPRFIQIKGINLEAEPMRFMLYTTNTDTPGYIGALGTKLGALGVNIATFALGRDAEERRGDRAARRRRGDRAAGAGRDRDAAADPAGEGAARSDRAALLARSGRPLAQAPARSPAERGARRLAGSLARAARADARPGRGALPMRRQIVRRTHADRLIATDPPSARPGLAHRLPGSSRRPSRLVGARPVST